MASTGEYSTGEYSMSEFNQLPEHAAEQILRGCCSSVRWVQAMAGGRPYRDADAMLAASDVAIGALREADLKEALAGHPRLGDGRVEPGWSSQEQAGVSSAGDASRAELEAGNAEYERTFGHIYLACATGRSAGDLAGFLRERLGNTPEQEWRVVAAELAKINRIRLRQLLGVAGDAS